MLSLLHPPFLRYQALARGNRSDGRCLQIVPLIKQLVANSKKIGGSAAGKQKKKRIEKNRSLFVL